MPQTVHTLTSAEATKLIKRAPSKSQFRLHVRIDLPVGADQVYRGGASNYLKLTRADALRLVSPDTIPAGLEEKGARIRVSIYTSDSKIAYLAAKEPATYWIG